MKIKTLVLISLVCTLLGMLLYAFTNDWIIIQIPSSAQSFLADYRANQTAAKKKITLFFWKDEKWHHETIGMVWSDVKTENIQYVIAHWLKLLDEDDMMHKKISIQSVLISPSGADAYVSFDRYPFAQDATIHEKLMWIEGILKTMRENKIPVQAIRFLVQHKPLQDPHLDFNNPWPIIGFSE